jgi:hypothetical protein
MGMRNYCAGYYDEGTGKMNFWIQAETEVGIKGTKGYLVDVPKLIFGLTGSKLHSVNYKKSLLYPVVEQNSLPSVPPPPQQQRNNIGGFIRPPFFWKRNRS